MKFHENEIEIRPGHKMRTWQSCDYYANSVELFHERTYFPHNVFKPVSSEQWTSCVGTKEEMEILAQKHGGHVLECFYSEGTFFLAFSDNDKAIDFCRSSDFDTHCLTMEKIKE